jgi:hypothetical protein
LIGTHPVLKDDTPGHHEFTDFNHRQAPATRSTLMNATPYTAPEQLFIASAHAGGWPKLGWCADEAVEEALTCLDEDVA